MGINIVIVVAVVIAAALVIRSYIARGGKGDCCGGADVVRAKRAEVAAGGDFDTAPDRADLAALESVARKRGVRL